MAEEASYDHSERSECRSNQDAGCGGYGLTTFPLFARRGGVRVTIPAPRGPRRAASF